MKITTVAVLALLAFVAAESEPETPKFDQQQVKRQKGILRLLSRYRQPLLWEDLATTAKEYKLRPKNYQVPQVVKDFLQTERDGEFLPFDQPISVLEDSHVEHIKLFINLLYHAKDYDTFYKTALYLRERVNKEQFIISFLISVKMREDTKHFILPPLCEIIPEFFFTSVDIQQIYDVKLQGVLRPLPRGQSYILPNYTDHSPIRTPEEKLSYFTEDVCLNEYFADLNYRYPYFLSGANYTIPNGEVRGDVFYHTLRQLYARYFLERLSNGLPDVAPLDYDKVIKTGYNPRLRLLNGDAFNLRPEDQKLPDADILTLKRIREYENRVSEAVDSGYVLSATDGRIRYKESEATNLLGNLIQNNADSIHPTYYGALYKDLLSLVGKYDPTQQNGLAGSVLGKYETMLRDPVYFQIVKRILSIFQQYQDHFEPYTKKELEFPGLKIEEVDVGRLITHMDEFRYEVDNSLKASTTEEIEKIRVFGLKKQLTRHASSYRIEVSSEQPTKAIFRTFFGPRYDSYGNEMTLDEARQYFVEVDRFVYELAAGDNELITRSFNWYGQHSMMDLERVVDLALEGHEDLKPSTWYRCVGAFPGRLLLPRGRPGGLPLRVYVIASPLPEGVPAAQVAPAARFAEARGSHFGDWFTELADGRPVAFPFDRRIPHPNSFRVPNSYIADVVVIDETTVEA